MKFNADSFSYKKHGLKMYISWDIKVYITYDVTQDRIGEKVNNRNNSSRNGNKKVKFGIKD